MITSSSNGRVRYARRLQNEKRFRYREKAFVIEGRRWLAELPPLGLPVTILFHTAAWGETAVNRQLLSQINAPHLLVSDAIMAELSETQTAPGVLAVLPMATQPLPEKPSWLLVLDAVRDPGNLGTILRTAAAAGVEGILLAPNCVDPFNPKVVRSSMGALLRLPLLQADWTMIGAKTAALQTAVATVDEGQNYASIDWRKGSAVIMGGEANGAGEEALKMADLQVTIPMAAQVESLNAAMATGILLFEIRRQRLQSDG